MEPKIKYTIGPDVDLNKTIIRDKNGKRITNRRAEKMAKEAIAEVIRRKELGDESVKSPKGELRLRLKLRKLLKKKGKGSLLLLYLTQRSA
jgi:hypothetical protein